MQESLSHNQLVIVLSEHPTLGMLLIPYIAEGSSEREELCLVEQAFHLSPKAVAQMSETEQKAIEIASHYTEKYLMAIYSKDKTISGFLRHVAEEPEKLKKIRLFIEKKLQEMMELIRTHNLPLYQKQSRSKLLYPHHAYHVNKQDIKVHFSFEVNEQSFNYQLQCYNENEPIPLTELKPVATLTSNPAILLLGMEVYLFQHIESSRLLPFTRKAQISVDSSFTEKYIDNILIPIARYHTIDARGIDIKEEKRTCESILHIDETIYDTPLLRLTFRYGDQSFVPHSTNGIKKYIYREAKEEKSSIRYFQRVADLEEKAIHLLQDAGLVAINDSHFKLSEDASEKNISEWVARHRTMLQESFVLTSEIEDKPYSLEEISIEQSYDNGPDWFELQITAVIGELRIPFSRFRKHILEERRDFLLPDGRVVLLPQEWFSKYANLMEIGTTRGKTICIKHSHIGIITSIMESDTHKDLHPLQPQQEYPVPIGLKAQLRPYQHKGYTWMMHLHKLGLGGCLADDMGLGKTLQALTLLQQIYSVEEIDNSPKEISGNANPTQERANNTEQELNFAQIEQPCSIDEMGQFELFNTLNLDNTLPACVVPTNKTQVSKKPGTLIVVPTSLLHNWKREAARFSNLSMAEFNNSTRFRAGHPELFFNRFHLIFVSYGILRSKIDILSQYCFEYIVLDESQNIKNSDSLTFRCATLLQSHHRLVLTGTPIENSLKDLWAQFHFLQPELLGNESAFTKRFINPIKLGNERMQLRLRQLITPFILRRSKREVAPELPPLTQEVIYCDMTKEQSEIYQQEKNGLRNILLQINKKQNQQFTVLNGISRLRQLACHPKMTIPDFNAESGKLEQIIDTYETLHSEGHKVLIFSSFVKHLELIAEEFRKRDWQYALLTGSSTNREEEIARFSQTEEIRAFLISLKAGGVGLNLTQADYVFIIDPWWNPAAEAQAIARAHRIGQNKQVIAYRFITKDSIEEKIIWLQEEKRKLAEIFITDSESMPALTDQEWIKLLE